MPLAGQKRKTGPLCSSHLRKGPALSYLAAMPNGCKGRFISFGEISLWVPETQTSSGGCDYFFFFEVFFSTFLVAAFAVFFAFFAFLAMSSSEKKLAQ